ncbi:MAG: hypothetical protein U0S49_10520 [Rhodospirillales bacterium]|nr:hypothetical protein [Rhodospirillales bacterium]
MKFRRLVTGIGVLPQKRLQTLLWSVAVLAALSAAGAASAAPCGNLLTASAATPSGFAAAYNPFTPAKELLLQGTDCAAGAAKISVGSGSAEQYVYKNALYWTGSAWQELPLSGSALISDTWYKGSATASMPIGETPRYLLGYVCQSNAGAWKCGCTDIACAKPQWQLQAVQAPAGAVEPSATAINGKLDGIWYWPMPKTPNGLLPTQSWSGAASTPSGDVYVAGMDHTTNSALYRLHDGVLSYVGDAKSASQAAGNWHSGETAEKFHTRPAWHNGRAYVATLDTSSLDATYLSRRGFHWYAYDTGANRFLDLSAAQPGGTGAAHGGVIAQVVDPANNCIYAAIAPTGDLYRYDIATGKSTHLGRPDYRRPYVYPGRTMWLDRAGRLYFTAGNDQSTGYGGSYDPAVFNHVYVYDPTSKTIAEKKTWMLHNQRAVDAAQCFSAVEERSCLLMDNVGHIYEFRDLPSGQTWTYLGSIGQESSDRLGYAWVFQVFPEQKKAYVLTTNGKFFEFDLVANKASFLGDLKALEPTLAQKIFLYGHDATAGARFYFAASSRTGTALLVAVDPDRLKAAMAAARRS